MASSARIQGRFGGYTHYMDVAVIGRDVGANTSRLRYNYFIRREVSRAGGSWNFYNQIPFSININGGTNSRTASFDFRANQQIEFVSGEITIAHNADGTLTVPFSASTPGMSGSAYFVAANISGSITLDTIPRAGKLGNISPNPVTAGSAVSIPFTKNHGSHTMQLKWSGAGSSGTISTNATSPTSWTPNPALLGSANYVVLSVVLETYSGGTLIGSDRKDISMRPAAAAILPTVGVGTPYDMRFRRTELSGSNWALREVIPFSSATVTDTFSATATCNLTVPRAAYATTLENQTVAVDVYDGAQWIDTELRFVLTRVEEDKADLTESVKYTGISFVDYLLSRNINESANEYTNANPGTVMRRIIEPAKYRGWGPRLEVDFTTALTSFGTPWSVNDISMDLRQDVPALQVLEGLVKDVQVEYRTQYRDNKAWLQMFNPGTGSDWTVTGSNVVNLATGAMYKTSDSAPVRKDYGSLLTRVRVAGTEERRTRENGAIVNPLLGHLEGTVAASDVKGSSQLDALGDAALRNQGTPTVERTFSYDLSSNVQGSSVAPYRTFRPGDWVLAPGDSGPVRVRVAQIGLTHDGQAVKATVTTGDMIPSGVAAVARRLTQTNAGAIAGGSLRAPTDLATAIPAEPEGLAVVADGYWDNTGRARSSALITWDPVTTSLGGSSIRCDLYEVWTRPELANPWVLAGVSATTSFTFGPTDINTTADFRVRARSTGNVYGDYSDVVSITMPLPDDPLNAPSSPELSADAVGTVSVRWNGILGGSTPPPWFAYVRAEIGASATGPWTFAGGQLRTAGDITIPAVGEGTWWFRLRAYDTLDVEGLPSAAASVEVVPIVADTRKPKPPVGLTATSYGYWSGPNPESGIDAAWTGVTQAEDDSPIDILEYELWGRPSDETDFKLLGTSESSAILSAPHGPIGEGWTVAVKAVATNLQRGELSTPTTVTLVGPELVLDAPSSPTLTSAFGLITVSWDGLLGGVTPPPPFRYVYAEMSATETGTYAPVGGALTRDARSTTISGQPAGSVRWVRLLAADGMGSVTTPSAPVSITVSSVDLGDLDESVQDAIDAAAAAGQSARAALNMIADGSFEAPDITTAWTVPNTATVSLSSTARTGGSSALIEPGTTAEVQIESKTILEVLEGQALRIEGYVLENTTGTVAPAGLSMWVRYGVDATSMTGAHKIADTPDQIDTTWRRFGGIWEVPAGALAAQVYLSNTGDITGTGSYLVDDITVRAMTTNDLIVDGTIVGTKIAAQTLTAVNFAAESVAAETLQANSVTAGKVAAEAITAREVAVESLTGDRMRVGTIEARHLSAGVGGEIDISANETVNIVVGQIDQVREDADGTAASLEELSTVYSFGPDGALISTPGSIYSLALANDAIEMRESGAVVSRWDSGRLLVAQLVADELIMGNHKIEKYNNGTVFRTL